MSLPQSTEYDEAIQNSRSAFIDSELKNATNDGPIFMGVPGGPVASGNFAIVYRFRTGARRLAVKCFTREKSDQQTRYELIHEHLAARNLPWTIDFKYIKEGIRVKGKTYPIVKMEWIEDAKTLLSYINDAVSSNQPLDSVCEQFYRMTSDLRRHSIAHGDLQHANLIISNGKLLLIDYDGMCVPKTIGLKSEEDGLPDYQHPRRHGGTLQSSMDHFSTLVIWTSLHALTIDNTLWRRWVRDDERLLFSRADFIRPDNSGLIRELLSFGDPKMSSVVEAIVKAASASSLEQVPHLVEVVSDGATIDTKPWWQPAVTPTEQPARQGPEESILLPSWIASSKTLPSVPAAFQGGAPILSFFSAIAIVSALLAGVMGIAGGIPAPLAVMWFSWTFGIYGICLHVAFLARPEVVSKGAAEKKLVESLADEEKLASSLSSKQAAFLKAIADHEQKIVGPEARMKTLEAAIDTIKRQSAGKLWCFSRDQAEKLSRADKAERDAVSQANAKKGSAKALYDLTLSQIAQELNSSVNLYTTQLKLLPSQAERDREGKFSAKFNLVVQSELAKIGIANNPVSGVNIHELSRRGFNTLADFSGCGGDGSLLNKSGRYIKVRGIGYARGTELVIWRKRVIESIRSRVPVAEIEAINHEVEMETRKKREHLESLREQARTKAANAKLQAAVDYDRTCAGAVREEKEARARAKSSLDALVAAESAFKSKVSADEVAECGPLIRELWSLQSVVNPARHLIKVERTRMQDETLALRREAIKAQERVAAARKDLARFSAITHMELIKHAIA